MKNSQARTGHQRGMGGRWTDDDDTHERHTDTNKLTRPRPPRVPSPRTQLGWRVRSGLRFELRSRKGRSCMMPLRRRPPGHPTRRARAAGLQQPYRACLSACGAAWNVTAADPRLLTRALSGRRPGCRKSRFPSVPRAADRQSPFPASFLADLAREIAALIIIDPNASSLLALSRSTPARQRAQPGVSCAVCPARVLYSTLNFIL